MKMPMQRSVNSECCIYIYFGIQPCEFGFSHLHSSCNEASQLERLRHDLGLVVQETDEFDAKIKGWFVSFSAVSPI